MTQTQTPPQNSANSQAFADAISAIVLSTAWTLEAWLHRGFGVRYIGGRGVLGFMIIALPAALCFPHDPKLPIACLTGFYVLLWLVHQIAVWYRRWKNKIDGHTLYSGRPHLKRLLPFLSEGAIKRLEPLLVLAAAYGMLHVNRPLACYLIYSGLALLFTSTIAARRERNRALDLSDAVSQQRRTAESFRTIVN